MERTIENAMENEGHMELIGKTMGLQEKYAGDRSGVSVMAVDAAGITLASNISRTLHIPRQHDKTHIMHNMHTYAPIHTSTKESLPACTHEWVASKKAKLPKTLTCPMLAQSPTAQVACNFTS